MQRSSGALAAVLLVLVTLALVMAAAATEPDSTAVPPPPSAPRPTGPVLFEDHFASLDAWQSDREGVWSVADSAVCGHLPDEKQKRGCLYAGSEDWQGCALDLDLLQLRGVDKGVLIGVRGKRGIAIDLRGGSYQDVVVYRGFHQLGHSPAPNPDGAWHHLRVEPREHGFAISVDGKPVLDCQNGAVPRGRIALIAYTGGQGKCSVQYANVIVTRLSNPPLADRP